ncbi:carboxymuconolactone decarboxylase family protein [Deinococcus psychrotolerans]|uniref:Carboxymuconolactone decarboxylase family protein n=1 Tax=Deinococcus psychrotolerans TaxID=2489213 RepID=A0A3G8YMC7_9DEIO|nr:carboxymuconolactone decarboxylase family protein [Deinococcus psychrotolerans]AZI42306.1 carboxymuconolactone decarboxylase family protein [Deinococcus psychrotolerans]
MTEPDQTELETLETGIPLARHLIFGEQHDRIQERLEGLDPDLARYVREFAYDTVYQRAGLDLKTKELLACSLLIGLGAQSELKTHLRGALRAGASETEVREALLFMIPYLGFPRVVAAFGQLQSLLEKQKE